MPRVSLLLAVVCALVALAAAKSIRPTRPTKPPGGGEGEFTRPTKPPGGGEGEFTRPTRPPGGGGDRPRPPQARHPLVCRLEDAEAASLEDRDCPGDLVCAGDVITTVQIDGAAVTVYFCHEEEEGSGEEEGENVDRVKRDADEDDDSDESKQNDEDEDDEDDEEEEEWRLRWAILKPACDIEKDFVESEAESRRPWTHERSCPKGFECSAGTVSYSNEEYELTATYCQKVSTESDTVFSWIQAFMTPPSMLDKPAKPEGRPEKPEKPEGRPEKPEGRPEKPEGKPEGKPKGKPGRG